MYLFIIIIVCMHACVSEWLHGRRLHSNLMTPYKASKPPLYMWWGIDKHAGKLGVVETISPIWHRHMTAWYTIQRWPLIFTGSWLPWRMPLWVDKYRLDVSIGRMWGLQLSTQELNNEHAQSSLCKHTELTLQFLSLTTVHCKMASCFTEFSLYSMNRWLFMLYKIRTWVLQTYRLASHCSSLCKLKSQIESFLARWNHHESLTAYTNSWIIAYCGDTALITSMNTKLCQKSQHIKGYLEPYWAIFKIQNIIHAGCGQSQLL